MSAPTAGQGKKLVFVGNSGVGKTCIIARFTRGSFDPNSPSGSAGFSNKTIEIPELNRSLALDIWDTVGQERFRALTKYFYQGAKMAILVYDITVKESFDSLKNYWYEDIKEHAEEDIVLAIAGNKADLYDKEDVPEDEARAFAKDIGAIFKLTSAQNNSGIDELFNDLAIKYLDPNLEINSSDNQKQEHKKEEEVQQNNTIKLNKKDITKENEKQNNKKSCC